MIRNTVTDELSWQMPGDDIGAPVEDKAHPYTALFRSLHGSRLSYYGRWIHKAPMVVTPERDAELREVQRILHACAHFYAGHYQEFLQVIDYDDAVLETLDYCSRYPFLAGTYRPDFLVGTAGDIRVCEITSRFFGNAYFFSYYYETAARTTCLEAGIDDLRSYMEEMLSYFANMSQGKKRIVVLKSADKSDSIPLYVPFYEALGLEGHVLESHEVEENLHLLEDAFVVSALNQRDLASFAPSTRHLIADVGCRNDFRTIYLLHDKRLFRLFFDDGFCSQFLTPEETAFLRSHVIQTYLPHTDADEFERARHNKDAYILKHHCLGKSEKVYAGCLCTPEQWDALFRPEVVSDMILQPFLQQKTWPTVWEGTPFDDYACGTILTVDDRYFGPGVFRTSSCPVVNQTDDRKIGAALTNQASRLSAYHLL